MVVVLIMNQKVSKGFTALNVTIRGTIGRSPYKALFGCDPKIGLSSSNIPLPLANTLQTEEELQDILQNSPNEYENVDNNLGHSSLQDPHITVGTTQNNTERTAESENIVLHGNNEDCESENIDKLHSRIKMELAAKKMRADSHNLHKVQKGDCVLLIIPKVDRGPSDPLNMTCVVIDQKNAVNQIACKYGIIKGWFGSESLILAGASFLSVKDVDQTKFLSVREAVMKTSGGQGYVKCTCKPGKAQCNSGRCVCRKKKTLCNSRCHQSLPCVNK
ncbi:hypothetical protein RI129_011929 [Pyrocoelia pectoralis]|uniref:Uncharacterized protein n=1 Tax=Pyrocoelia pectoralis TaxID=417401 RepID=A0AAN7ZDF3_9COLE